MQAKKFSLNLANSGKKIVYKSRKKNGKQAQYRFPKFDRRSADDILEDSKITQLLLDGMPANNFVELEAGKGEIEKLTRRNATASKKKRYMKAVANPQGATRVVQAPATVEVPMTTQLMQKLGRKDFAKLISATTVAQLKKGNLYKIAIEPFGLDAEATPEMVLEQLQTLDA